ncbi:MAG: hypothetical protein ACE369_05500 [Roseovarius sp.]
MTHLIKTFILREDGAVTVDWVVLTAAVVGLAGGLGATVMDATSTASGTISGEITSKSVSNGD